MGECIPLPHIAPPGLPSPLSASLPVVAVAFDPNLCCKFVSFPIKVATPALPAAILNPAIMAVLKKDIALVCAFVNSLPPKCPREP